MRSSNTATHLSVLIVRSKLVELLAKRLAIDKNRLAVKQNPQHTARQKTVTSDVLPLMGTGTLNGDIALAQDSLLAGVENQLELALDNDTIVERHGAVHGRDDTGGKVNHAADRAVMVVQRRLQKLVLVPIVK